ncbi:MAG: hypothetical protein IJN36_03810 [Clostridia bacterium]|nr:hypothetical protein [Clostridia bacterium]
MKKGIPLLRKDTDFEKKRKIGEAEIAMATQTLREYKNAKGTLEARIVEDEQWWRLRHNDVVNRKKSAGECESVSAWLFNTLTNKHADAMDSFPEASVLPREKNDVQEAKKLSGILPAIMEHNNFEEIYSNNWWYKLKHGCSAYGVFWNSELENGLGDIQIRKIDLLNIFWEPGITDIQKSRNLFVVDLRDIDILESEYPTLRGKDLGNAIDVKQYIYDDSVDTSGKALVVDWYYKVRSEGGKTLLHYCKFVGDNLLFASENCEEYRERGWYDHGEYPIVLDTLFPEEGTPVGFGFVAVTKNPQMYIDKLGSAILENALMAAKPRYFSKISAGVNESEFLDWSRPIVHVEGDINEERLRPINVSPLPASSISILKMKIDELKETSANSDFNRGNAGGGVTAASAIAALQEAGDKVSRDMIKTTYRAFTMINYLCIELIRQFYGEIRSFRINGIDGGYGFTDYNNALLIEQGSSMRRPIFDISVKAHKKSPYSRLAQNEMAKELFRLGFFEPRNSFAALSALEIMDFEGKSAIEVKIRELASTVKEMRGEENDKNNGAEAGEQILPQN